MKYFLIIIIIFFLTVFNSLAQTIVIVDSLNKKALPFVAIKYKNSGFYTSERGLFEIDQIPSDSIKIEYLGYKEKILYKLDIKDSIFLTPKITRLDEVILLPKEHRLIKNIKPRSTPKSYSSWVLSPKTELLIAVYPKPKIANFNIDKIIIPFKKIFERKELKNSKIKALVRINIYSIKDNKPAYLIHNSNPISINLYNKDKISFDISDKFINLDEEGIFIGIEMIGYFKDGLEIIDHNYKSYVRPTLTKKTIDFDSTTYLKYTFKNQSELIPLKKIFTNISSKNKEIIRNLNIGMIISN